MIILSTFMIDGLKTKRMGSAKKALAEFPVKTKITVKWGEMDAAGHVNNLVHLRWFEHARIVYLDQLGYPSSRRKARKNDLAAS